MRRTPSPLFILASAYLLSTRHTTVACAKFNQMTLHACSWFYPQFQGFVRSRKEIYCNREMAFLPPRANRRKADDACK